MMIEILFFMSRNVEKTAQGLFLHFSGTSDLGDAATQSIQRRSSFSFGMKDMV
jgi:hypothetical protein